MRVVIDTNVLVSAFLSTKGAPAQILARFATEAFELVVSQPLLDKYHQALGYERVQALHGMSEEEIQQQIADLRGVAVFVSSTVSVNVVSDPDDNMLFSTAIEGHADIIVSGGAAVQAVKEHQGVRVLSPAQFLAFLDQQS
jgi:putative PIN family toxin of toxin-antitoxin system